MVQIWFLDCLSLDRVDKNRKIEFSSRSSSTFAAAADECILVTPSPILTFKSTIQSTLSFYFIPLAPWSLITIGCLVEKATGVSQDWLKTKNWETKVECLHPLRSADYVQYHSTVPTMSETAGSVKTKDQEALDARHSREIHVGEDGKFMLHQQGEWYRLQAFDICLLLPSIWGLSDQRWDRVCVHMHVRSTVI